jgi:hypothetical protein
MQAVPRVGLEALLTPDNCVLALIDHQPFQLANVNSHDRRITWLGMVGELQRDWARSQYLKEVVKIFADHGGATGSVLAWEMQLLRATEVKGA